MEQRERRDTLPARALRREAACLLKAAGIEEADADAGQLLFHAAGFDTASYLLHAEEPLPEPVRRRFMESVRRRADREPLQYIIGEAPFYGRLFVVRPGVLIPRFDTEALCQQALDRLRGGERVLDLCTGSGALAVALAALRPGIRVAAGDISPLAAALARENAARCGVSVDVRLGDLFAPFRGETFDMIVSNPPYIPAGQLAGLQEEVRREPALALDGGADGLDFYRRIIAEAPRYLAPGGWLLLEFGSDQAADVKALMARDFEEISVFADLDGHSRGAAGRRKPWAM